MQAAFASAIADSASFSSLQLVDAAISTAAADNTRALARKVVIERRKEEQARPSQDRITVQPCELHSDAVSHVTVSAGCLGYISSNTSTVVDPQHHDALDEPQSSRVAGAAAARA